MSPVAKRLMMMLLVLAPGSAVLAVALALGQMANVSSRVMLGGTILLAVLIVATAVIMLRLSLVLRHATESLVTILAAHAEQENPVGGTEEEQADPLLLGPEVSQWLSAISERMGTLGRQRDEQKLAARLAQRRAKRLETVLQSVPNPVIVTDAMDRLVMTNAAADRLLHCGQGTEGTQPIRECVQDAGLRDLLLGAYSLPAGKEAECCLEDGQTKRILNVSLWPLADDGQGGIRGAVAVLHDVTRERTAARMKTEFVANASHELRTPLGGIKAYLEMLTDGEVKDEETRSRFYDVMQGEVERLSVLVDNILNIARIEAGIVKVSKEQVPLSAIVQEVVEAIQPQATANGIDLTCEALPVFFHVLADKEMMRRAVFNLVSNALKYTPRGGSVKISMRVDEAAGVATVHVADTGVGISEQDLPRMFQKFFRVESSRKMAKGTGLGLVLVKEVVESLHGGKVTVKSKVGEGSVFSIQLPLALDKTPARAAEQVRA